MATTYLYFWKNAHYKGCTRLWQNITVEEFEKENPGCKVSAIKVDTEQHDNNDRPRQRAADDRVKATK